ncbi:membrane protein, partial [Streptomyces varsoviensis]
RRTFRIAGAAGVVGFFVVPLAGAVLGFVAAIYGVERRRLGGHGQAWASTRGVMRAIGTSVLVELFACLLVVGAWVGATVWG